MFKWIFKLFAKKPKGKRIKDFEESAYRNAVFDIWFGRN